MDLVSSYEGSGRGIVADNYFSSMRLVVDLLAKRLTYCGTIRKNRREIPPIVRHNTLGSQQDLFLFNEAHQVTLLRHTQHRSDFVNLMSSAHFSNELVHFEDGRGHLPAIISYYNCNKGGVDEVDFMLGCYTSQFATRRWPLKVHHSYTAIKASKILYLLIFLRSSFIFSIAWR